MLKDQAFIYCIIFSINNIFFHPMMLNIFQLFLLLGIAGGGGMREPCA
jgi:hypothetical protein